MRNGRIKSRKYSGKNGELLFGRPVDIDADPAAGWTPERVRSLQHRVKQHLGWSLGRMAKEMGVDRSHVKNMETGKRPITPRTALALENVENILSFTLKDEDSVQARTAHYLVVALVRHKPYLSRKDKRLLKRVFG